MCEVSEITPLEIPDLEVATPEGSVNGQQVSPLLMSIKKLVSQQEVAGESEGSFGMTPATELSSAGMECSRKCLFEP